MKRDQKEVLAENGLTNVEYAFMETLWCYGSETTSDEEKTGVRHAIR